MMATVDLLTLYLHAVEDEGQNPDSVYDCGLVCEYHEDWACVVKDRIQLVSGKHKEPNFGAYTTVGSLLGDGGLYHLFDRWHSLGGVPGCRLVTTAGVDSDAAAIAKACDHFRDNGLGAELPSKEVKTALRRLATDIAARRALAKLDPLADLETDVVPRFLAALLLQCGEPRRVHLPTLGPSAYAGPVARAIGRPDLEVAIWEAVLSLVRARMRAAGPAKHGMLPSLTASAPDALERRTVTVADVHVALMAAISTPLGFAPLPQAVITNKMAVKMYAGECSATSIARAELLRKRFMGYRRAMRSQPGNLESEVDLQRLLRRVADHATAATRTSAHPWGAALWAEMEARFEAEAGTGAAVSLDTDMLLGGVSDLANSCKVWYSEPFDAQSKAREARAERP